MINYEGNPLDPSRDPVEAMMNARHMIDFVCEFLTKGETEGCDEISTDAISGLYYILDAVRWSIEAAAEKLTEEAKESAQ
jgi:hypothetical protein